MNDIVAVETDAPRKRRGAMKKPELLLKKRKFAEMMLDPNSYSRDQIMQQLGISERTYYKWSNDPMMLHLGGFEPERQDIATKAHASRLKRLALLTFEDVMMNSRNDMARVKAAETLLAMDTTMREEVVEDARLTAEKYLAVIQPVFITGTNEILAQVAQTQASRPQLPKFGEELSSDIDGYEVEDEDDEEEYAEWTILEKEED